MKKYFLFLGLLFSIIGYSKTNPDSIKIDSLKKHIRINKIDSNTVKNYIAIGNLYSNLSLLKPDLSDSVDIYFNKGKTLATKAGYQKIFAKEILDYCSVFMIHPSKPNEDAVRKLKYSFYALRIFEDLNDSIGIANTYDVISFLYYSIGDYENGILVRKKGLAIFESKKDKRGVYGCLSFIGDFYKELKQYDSSLVYNKKALENFMEYEVEVKDSTKKKKLINEKSLLINNICESYNNKHLFSYTIDFYKENDSIFLSFTGKDQFELMRIIERGNILGAAYRELNDYDNALSNFKMTINIYNNASVMKPSWYMPNLFLNYGKTYDRMILYNEAIEQFNKGLEYSNFYDDKADLLIALSETYYKVGNISKSFELYKQYINAKDSITIVDNDEKNLKQAITLSLNFEFKKQIEIEKLEKEKQNTISEEKSRKQKIVIWSVVGGLLLVVIFSGFIFRSLRTTQRQKQIIEKQKMLTDEKNKIIEEKNKDITDSINYAQRIQKALLASDNLLNKNLGEHFVLFKPKDIVSGDFYWATEVKEITGESSNRKEAISRFYFAVCDSTGHGVPGAFMSLLNISFLNEAINEEGIIYPNKILNHVRQRLIQNISQDGGKDGMDGILLCFDKTKNTIYYAGANNAPYLMNGALEELPTDNMPVGMGDKMESFNHQVVSFQSGNILYLYTDGFADQFGGPKGKKFKYKPLNELLAKISNQPMAEQKTILEKTFQDWKGGLEQVDDVLIVGIKV